MIPKEVFHYTSASTALEKILFSKQLKIGKIKDTNDPKESKEHIFGSFMSSPPYEDWDYSSKEFADLCKKLVQIAMPIKLNEWRTLCFSKNPSSLESWKDSINDDPFLSGCCLSGMWAHYADKHKGVCLKFNGNKLDERIRNLFDKDCVIHCGDVGYCDLGVRDRSDPFIQADIRKLTDKGLEEPLREYFIKNYEVIFFRKSKDWENEYEFRWLVHSEKVTSDLFIQINDIAEEVFVGCDFPEVYYPSLFKLCKDLRIRAYKIDWSNGTPTPRTIFQP